MKKIYIIIPLLICVIIPIHSQWMWNTEKMKNIKKELNSEDYKYAYENLIRQADIALNGKDYSVTYKEGTAPSGDKHDYVSLSRYAWPNPDKPDGLPYIQKDGQSNPELEKYDRNPLGDMATSVFNLSVAYYYSGDERYARKAVEQLRVWFIDKDTKMNPHLDYAQFIPGTNGNKGRAAGLIDAYSFVRMLNAVQLLSTSKNYTGKDKKALQQWFTDFSGWWQTTDQAIAERNATNNHGLAYDIQLTTYLLFSGQTKAGREIIEAFPTKRMFTQIEPDGKQPHELRRTLAFHYSIYNIQFMVDMFATAQNSGLNIIGEESGDGRSLFKAVDFLTPYLAKTVTEWPYQQISGWDKAKQNLCYELFRISSIDPSRADYWNLYEKYSTQGVSDVNRLLYGFNH